MPKKYYEALEELRIMNNITVSDLCDGVIDERSYYRYLSNDRDASLKVLMRLLENIKIPMISFLNYTTHSRTSDGSADSIRFIYRAHVRKYDDIEVHYSNVKKGVRPDKPFNIVICAYILHYEFKINKITLEDYSKRSLALLKLLPPENDLFTLPPRLLHYFNTNQTDLTILTEYGTSIRDLDFRLQPLFAMNIYELYLRIAALNHQFKVPYTFEIYDKLNTLLGYFLNRYYTVFGYVYGSYLEYSKGNKDYLKPLLKYFHSILILTDTREIKETADFVKLVFNVNIYDLLIEDIKTTDFNR